MNVKELKKILETIDERTIVRVDDGNHEDISTSGSREILYNYVFEVYGWNPSWGPINRVLYLRIGKQYPPKVLEHLEKRKTSDDYNKFTAHKWTPDDQMQK